MTYDRAVIKLDAARVRAANLALFTPPPTLKTILDTSRDAPTEWRYVTAKPADNWMAPGFDAAAWTTGPAGFGARNPPGAVIRTPWTTADIWIRRTFELPAGFSAVNPQILLHHDEDAEVYVNGTLVLTVTGYTQDYETATPAIDLRQILKPGSNSLAVHCHQTNGGQYIDVGIVDVVPQGQRGKEAEGQMAERSSQAKKTR